MKYDVDYFIKKFKAIPSKEWTIMNYDDLQGRHCALGHCTHTERPWLRALGFKTYINDLEGGSCGGKGKTPKTRVLNWLKSLKGK